VLENLVAARPLDLAATEEPSILATDARTVAWHATC
jgi:hypothetical protein